MKWSDENEGTKLPPSVPEPKLWRQFIRFGHGVLFTAVAFTLGIIGVVATLVWLFS